MRIAIIANGRLVGALFVTETGELPPRDWLIAQLAAPDVAPTLLAGRARGAQTDHGPINCACFDLRFKKIVAAISRNGGVLGNDVSVRVALGGRTIIKKKKTTKNKQK